ncbi:MAG TPA: DUF2892 domain-containing protein [Pirellulaceae bacterium]|nr:DUF2892 domain-containing protein [Pirellulaceae bacterium]
MMIPSTVERVPQNTDERWNRQIQRQTEQDVAAAAAGGPAAIERRLEELDREWDIERTLEANAASLSLAGVILGATTHRGFFFLPGIVGAFLLQHAIQGWCPPVPVFRRLGFRTQPEIERERYALKALRGDFQNIAPSSDGTTSMVQRALNAVEA